MNNHPQFLIVDLFCGAGGTTIGFEQSKVAKVIAAVNHDPKAIESHWKNHPDITHFEEDIRTLDLTELVRIVAEQRAQHPEALLVLWASLECTNFSKAKGGQPREADSRTLADHLHRYITAISPDYIQIENVVEFMSWGPLDANGRPESRRNGCDWLRWCAEVRKHGYSDQWREMNAADFGARTSRNRLFGCFAKPRLPIRWPDATHAKNPQREGMFGKLEPWQACRPCLDLDDKGASIFEPGRIKSDKTFQRIYAGLVKYVAGMSMKEFMVKWRGHKGSNYQGSVSGTDAPSDTITTMNHLGVAQAEFLVKYTSTDPKTGELRNASIDAPAPTIGTQRIPTVAQVEFIVQSNGGSPMGKAKSSAEPCNTITAQDNKSLVLLNTYYGNSDSLQNADTASPTITTKDRMGIIQAEWLDKQYSGEENHQSIDEPAGTILPNPKAALVTSEWIDRNFSQGGKDNDVNGPAGSITAVPKMNLVEAVIMPTSFDNGCASVEEPLSTITANRKWHYILNPQHGGHTQGVDRPSPTIIARQDKAPLYLVDVVEGNLTINVLDTDSETVRNIKAFMAMYGIIDIRMRMLKVKELKKIQGFPDDYELLGNQADQKKFIGNSVCPIVVEKWAQAMAEAVEELRVAA